MKEKLLNLQKRASAIVDSLSKHSASLPLYIIAAILLWGVVILSNQLASISRSIDSISPITIGGAVSIDR